MRRRLLRFAAALGAASLLAPGVGTVHAATIPVPVPSVEVPPVTASQAGTVVFAAYTRNSIGNISGNQALYTVGADGAGLARISPDDGRFYDWPSWAMNGNAIVYSAGSPTSTEQDLYLSAADGSGAKKLVDSPWLNAQPKVSPDGRSMIFSSEWGEYPKVGVYKLDLPTLQVTNLSAQSFAAGLDGDPRYSRNGGKIVFASSYTSAGPSNTQIYSMNPDGSGRTRLTNDDFFDTDPTLSPDGRYVAYSSYQGTNQPIPGQPNNGFTFSVADWHIMLLDLTTGQTRSLTGGRDCTAVNPFQPCLPTDGSGWVPVWSPDGSELGFVSVISPILSGIYAMRPDGTDLHTIIQGSQFAIGYWDWTTPGVAPAGALAAIGSAVPTSRLLFGGSVFSGGEDQPPTLYQSSPDRWNPSQIGFEGRHLSPTFARWFPDRRHIVFTARVGFDRGNPHYTPEPPRGHERRVHVTLDQLNSVFQAPPQPDDVAHEQVFMADADGGNVKQLTTPWTEDWMDAIADGDARGNTEPDVSPDGRYVIFTDVSTIRYETFILRLDLATGEVVNLSNVTAGAQPVADAQARYSPDGNTIAISSSVGGNAQIYLMNADGTNFRAVTNDDFYNSFPSWSPDGSKLVFSSYRGGGLPVTETDDLAADARSGQLILANWYLITVDLGSGSQSVLTTAADSPAFRPVWSPDGTEIAYITVGKTLAPDIYVIGAGGGTPRPLQLTLLTKEEYVDWR